VTHDLRQGVLSDFLADDVDPRGALDIAAVQDFVLRHHVGAVQFGTAPIEVIHASHDPDPRVLRINKTVDIEADHIARHAGSLDLLGMLSAHPVLASNHDPLRLLSAFYGLNLSFLREGQGFSEMSALISAKPLGHCSILLPMRDVEIPITV
jgi:hypothetical protein